MSEITEPAFKRAKVAETSIESYIDDIINSKDNLYAVLSDDFYKPMPFIKVYIGTVKNIKELSKIILILNEKVPLKELQHLKRARKKEVLLCPTHYLNSLIQESIQDYLEENVNELKDSFEYFKVMGVPSHAPKLKKQNAECSRIWACNFHPNKYLEKLFSGEFFTEVEIMTHRCYLGMAFETARYYMSHINNNLQLSEFIMCKTNATVIVDPTIQSVVAVTFDNRHNHPTQHSAMLAIDNVAKTQNGGAWDTAADIEEVSLRGIDKNLLLHLKNKFPSVKFGARNYLTKEVLDEKSMNASESPYLCTGYYIYLMKEPCVMCSMGLVHARANRVFFYLKNSESGGVCSQTKLQCVPSLNHHFEVFTDCQRHFLSF